MFQQNTGDSWHLADIDGHPIHVSPFFLVLIGLFAFMGLSATNASILTLLTQLGIWVPTLFLGILLHELGHATAMKRFGFGTSKIVLHGFGGVTINQRRQNAPSGQSIIISLAGPVTSFLLAVASFGIYLLIDATVATGAGVAGAVVAFFSELFRLMGLVNAIWGIFNLLPINPLDGGHVVLHALRGKLRDRRKAMRYTAMTSLATLGALALVSVVVPIFDPLFALLLGGIFGVMNWRILQSTKQSGGPPTNRYGRF